MKQMLDRWLKRENKAKTKTEEKPEEPALPINQTILGDCLEALQTFPDNFFDSVVTDPPYGLEFMGKEWDKFEPKRKGQRWAGTERSFFGCFEEKKMHLPQLTIDKNKRCKICGHYKFSGTPCECETPEWEVDNSYKLSYQEFCYLWGKEVYRVLKHGGHLLVFGGTRMYHRLTCGLEDAGFEIRDMIAWIYGSGFPKSLDIGKAIDKEKGVLEQRKVIGFKKHSVYPDNPDSGAPFTQYSDTALFGHSKKGDMLETKPISQEAEEWDGWGTALKPSIEPICLARKPPSEKNIAQNVLKWRTGGLNINAGRIQWKNEEDKQSAIWGHNKHQISERLRQYNIKHKGYDDHSFVGYLGEDEKIKPNHKGRFPANTILDPQTAQQLDKQSGERSAGGYPALVKDYGEKYGIYGKYKGYSKEYRINTEIGGASRFFYIAKAGRGERYGYCKTCEKVIPQENWENKPNPETGKNAITCPNCKAQESAVFHVTVKPLDLMKYLVRLVTPKNGIVLDPFIGSGTTGIACLLQGFNFVGIEIDPVYHKIALHRLKPYLEQEKLEVFMR